MSITRLDARPSWGRAPEVPGLTTAGAGHQQSANTSQAHTKPPGPLRTWGTELLVTVDERVASLTSASKPCLQVSLHTAPQLLSPCHGYVLQCHAL